MQMNNLFDLQRVVWNDGDVLTAEHFHALELSIDTLNGLGHVLSGLTGFVRDPRRQRQYNQPDCVSIRHEHGSTYYVSVERLMGISNNGKIVKIDERRVFEVTLSSSNRTYDNECFLYLIPEQLEKLSPENPDVPESGVQYANPGFQMAVSDERDSGLVVARLVFHDATPEIDSSFIPYSVFVSSSETSLRAWQRLRDSLVSYISLLESYVWSLSQSSELSAIWNASCSLLRLVAQMHGATASQSLSSIGFFLALSSFFSATRADVRTVATLLMDKATRQRAIKHAETLDTGLLISKVEQQDLSGAYRLAAEWLVDLTDFLSILPLGPEVEKTLRIRHAELSVGQGFGNRISITLENPLSLHKGMTNVRILLREISHSEPMVNNVRIGFDNPLYPQLLDLPDILQRQDGDSFTYSIHCPKELINKEQVSTITLYLPQPFGEDVPDLKSRISIFVQE